MTITNKPKDYLCPQDLSMACRGNACMAWRNAREQVILGWTTGQWDAAGIKCVIDCDEMAHRKAEYLKDNKPPKAKLSGYCGLAGKP